MTSLDRLLSHASSSLSKQEPEVTEKIRSLAGLLLDDLLLMLRRRNGFYALESALHVFPAQSSKTEIGIIEWNEDSLWRNNYKELADGCLFFAEDVFGGQFCIKENAIHAFEPETGRLEYLTSNM